ncbi:MAG: spermidine synthase [Myxococcota bacterium]
MRSSSARVHAAALIGLFALSGCAALVLETTWLRWFRLLFGATAPATSATLVAFFGGQALGAAWAARAVGGWSRPLRSYGLLELGAAALAAAVPLLLAALDGGVDGAYASLAGSPAALAAARFAVATVATLPASLLMGATLPAIGAAWLAHRGELGTRGSALYAANLLGGAAGAVLGAFVLPAALGVAGTCAVGVGLLGAVGAAALWLARSAAPAEAAPPEAPPSPSVPSALSARARTILAALSGFGVFALQVLLVRGLALVLDQSAYAFGATLAVVLCALALGAGGVALLRARTAVRVESALALCLALAGLGIAAFPAVLRDLTGGFDPGVALAAGVALPALALAAASAGLPLLAAGAVLPLLFASAGNADDRGAPARPLGTLVAVNTLGAIAGALAAPYLLLAWLHLWSAFLVIALLYAVAAVFVPLGDRRTRLRRDVALGFGWIFVLTRASPLSVDPVRMQEGEELVWLATSPGGVVSVVQQGPYLTLRTDSHYDLGGTADRLHQERQGHLAGLVRPGAKRALWIGSATGISAGALLARPLESLTLVELQPAVADAGALFFAHANRGVHDDPRVRVVRDDARSFVAGTDERFDLIVADLFVPWRAGTGSLYSAEHFAAVRARLADTGAFVQWLPLYQLSPDGFASIAATFRDVFPQAAIFRADFFGRFPVVALVGFSGAVPRPEALAGAALSLARAGETDRWVGDPVGLWSLYVGPLAALSAELDAAPRNTDDRPRVELTAPRARARGEGLLVGDAWVRASARAGAAVGGSDPVFPRLPPVAVRAARAGARLQAAGASWVAGRAEQAAAHMSAAAADLPPALLDPDRPDPSAAELWPDAR